MWKRFDSSKLKGRTTSAECLSEEEWHLKSRGNCTRRDNVLLCSHCWTATPAAMPDYCVVRKSSIPASSAFWAGVNPIGKPCRRCRAENGGSIWPGKFELSSEESKASFGRRRIIYSPPM